MTLQSWAVHPELIRYQVEKTRNSIFALKYRLCQCACGLQTLRQLEAVHGGHTTQLPEEQCREEAEIMLQLACWSAETGHAVKGDIIGACSSMCWDLTSTRALEHTTGHVAECSHAGLSAMLSLRYELHCTIKAQGCSYEHPGLLLTC